MSETRIPKRSEVKIENTWAVEDIFKNDEEWERNFADIEKYQELFSSFKGQLCKSSKKLLEYLRLGDEASLLIEKIYAYAHLKSDEDMGNSTYLAMTGKFMSRYTAFAASVAFADPEIISISDSDMKRFYEEQSELKLYRHYLGRLREQKAHTLSECEEKILAAVSDMAGVPNKTASAMLNADLRFPDALDSEGKAHQITQGTYITCMQSSDRILRKNAFESLYNTLRGFRNTSASLIDGQMKKLNFYSQVRKYSSSLEAALSSNEVPIEVYHNLISTVHENMHYMHKYMRLRKRLMKLEELHMYDIYPTLVEEAENKITFEEAKKTVLEALAPLGKDYTDIVKHAFENRWIDVYENEGKRGGAYSSGCRPHPYVLLNYENNFDNMFTLAHEMGHAMHSYLSMKNQPTVYSDYVIFVAEVASTCNEALLMSHLLSKTQDKKQRAYLINYFLEQFRTTLYRQTMFAEFELKISSLVEQGNTLTADILCKLYRDLNIEYYGEDVEIDSEIDMEWARIPHFFMNFYVFQYATGFSAAMALSQKILSEGIPAVKNYLDFLSGGCSASPIELLRKAGVDMTTPDSIKLALDTFNRLIDELDAIFE